MLIATMKITANLLPLLLLSITFMKCETHQLTKKEVPLYIRQSWLKLVEPFFSVCICESRVEASVAFRSIINSEIASSPCLKSFYKCLAVNINVIDATTGDNNKEEILKQIEGVTPQIFEECNALVADEVDLTLKVFKMYVCLVDCLAKPTTSSKPE